MTTMTLSELLELSERVLAQSHPSEQGISILEEYCEAFDLWFAAHGADLSASESKESSRDLRELLTRHESIVKLTERFQKSIPDAFRRLRQRGKGILAYTDLLPRQISSTKPKKG